MERHGDEKGKGTTEACMSEEGIERLVQKFNERIPIGSPVTLIEDDGSQTTTCTRSKAWKLRSGASVVKVEGKTGIYDLSRIRV